MLNYPILIPSRGRHNDMVTVNRLPKSYQPHIHVFTLEGEAKKYHFHYPDVNIVVASTSEDTISQKRGRMAQWAADEGHEWFYMFDDDLTFFRRRSVEDTRLVMLETEQDFQEMFQHCENVVHFHDKPLCAVGISIRQGNNNLGYEGAWNTRLIRAGLYNTHAFLSCEHDRLQFMGDFDVMLQMLEKGYDNHVIAKFAQDHRGTNARGGCAHQRDEETMELVANRLAELHPGVVKTKKKQNKGGKLATRTDVTIYWKKARISANL